MLASYIQLTVPITFNVFKPVLKLGVGLTVCVRRCREAVAPLAKRAVVVLAHCDVGHDVSGLMSGQAVKPTRPSVVHIRSKPEGLPYSGVDLHSQRISNPQMGSVRESNPHLLAQARAFPLQGYSFPLTPTDPNQRTRRDVADSLYTTSGIIPVRQFRPELVRNPFVVVLSPLT